MIDVGTAEVKDTSVSVPVTAAAVMAPRRWTLVAYGGLALPLCLAEIPIILYLPAFYAQELHLSAALVGAAFLCARLWDGLADLLVGWLSDRSTSRFGRRKPWVIICTPFLMVSTWFLCNPPRGAGLVYLSVWAALFYTAFTAMKIPYLSWGTELASDYGERSRVTAFRETFTVLGNLLFVAAPLILLPAGAPLSDVLFMVSIAVLVTAPLTALSLGVYVRDGRNLTRVRSRLFAGLATLAKDRVLVRFMVLSLLIWTAEGVVNSLAVFSFGVGLGLPNRLFVVIFSFYVITLCVLPLTMRTTRHWEKHSLLALSVAIKALGIGSLLLLPPGNFPLVLAAWVIVGIAQPSFIILPTSILADIVDHGEVMVGERRSGAYVAVYNLVLKVGLALGVGLSFGLMQLFHFDPSASIHSEADAQLIRLLGFGLPALLLVPAAVLLLKHPITKNVQLQLRAAINSRA